MTSESEDYDKWMASLRYDKSQFPTESEDHHEFMTTGTNWYKPTQTTTSTIHKKITKKAPITVMKEHRPKK